MFQKLEEIRPVCLLLALVLAALGSSPAAAQFRDPRPRTQPIVQPASIVPAAAVQRLAWGSRTANGWQLYSAGDDKVVRQWTLAVLPDGRASIEAAGRLLWPIYHGPRGMIYALDAHPSPAGDVLAFGGLGSHPAQVNLASTDPAFIPRVLLDELVRARNVVRFVDYSPDGTQLVVAYGNTSRVLLWNAAAGAARPTAIETSMNDVRRATFSPNGQQIAILGFDGAVSRVQIWSNAGRFIKETTNLSPAYDIAWIDDDNWRAATSKAVVDSDNAPRLNGWCNGISRISSSPVAYALCAYDEAARKTTVGVHREGESQVAALEQGTFSGVDAVLAASPDGRYVAAAGVSTISDGQQNITADVIRVWDATSGKLLAQVPDGVKTKPLGGPIGNLAVFTEKTAAGGTVEKVAFAWGDLVPPGQILPPFTKEFRLVGRRLFNVKNGGGAGKQAHVFQLNKKDERQMYVFRDGNEYWGPLPLRGGNRPRSYAMHPGGKLIALGYADGIVICDLAKLKGSNTIGLPVEEKVKLASASILRGFYGHPSLVTCLAFSPDGSWLASGSLDGTICGWSLEKIGQSRAAEFGVSFVLGNDRFLQVANEPARGTSAWEAGFRKGQKVSQVEVAGNVLPPVEWRSALAELMPGQEAIVTVADAKGGIWKLASTASYDPLWTLFPQRDGDWAMWTPPGHFETNTADVSRVEMHVNLSREAAIDGVERGAVRLPASDFRDLFHEAKLVIQPDGKPLAAANGDLVVAGAKGVKSFVDARRGTALSVLDFVVTKKQTDLPREVQTPPTLKIVLRPDGRSADFQVKAEGGETLGDLQLWLNGQLLDQRAPNAAAGTASGQWQPSDLRAGRNDLVGVASLTSQSGATYYRTVIPVAGPASLPAERKLHFLGVGVTELENKVEIEKASLVPLSFANRDVLAMAERLKGVLNSGASPYQPGSIVALASDKSADAPPTEANILAQLKRLAAELQNRPDDMAIVMFSGHGELAKGGFRFIAKDTKTVAAPSNITSITLQEHLSQLPCRCLLLLDTCHSQGVQVQQQLQDWPGLDLGPIVLASCGRDEVSFEDDNPGARLGPQQGGPLGHGYFTASLLEAVSGLPHLNFPPSAPWDLNGDGQLSVGELCQFAIARTQEIAGDGFAKQQTPTLIRSVTFTDADRLPLWRAHPQPTE